VKTFIYGDRAETVAALLRAVLQPAAPGFPIAAHTDVVTVGQGPDGAINGAINSATNNAASNALVVALRGMTASADAYSAASAIIVSIDDYDLLSAAQISGKPVHTCGFSPAADFAASAIESTLAGTTFILTHREASYRVSLQLLGEQQVLWALAAIAAASVLGVEIDHSIAMVGALAVAERWVMQPRATAGGAVMINDAGEATRESMAASLKALALFTVDGRRSVAVLGALDSLPADALDDHDSIGRLVVRLNIKKLVVVGHAARHIQVAAALEGSWDGESVLVESPEEAYDLLSGELGDGDVVLVKSSTTAGLRFFGDKLGGASE
jgi:UDP-N-acetylmuramoyl-tripeptide--D-alanyl-D-alanine ligase